MCADQSDDYSISVDVNFHDVTEREKILAKRNHYNPCFWTAYWNPDYYRAAISDTCRTCKPRTQQVHALSIMADKIFETNVDSIHFDRLGGVGKLSGESLEDFVRRARPDRVDQFLKYHDPEEYEISFDPEELLTKIEATPPYEVLRQVIRQRGIQSRMVKSNIGCFVVLQWLRSHAIMNAMLEWHAELGHNKFEHFYTLHSLLKNCEALATLALPLVACRWTLFKSASDEFPLCDSPILSQQHPQSIMVALSPRLLLEIQPQIRRASDARVVSRKSTRSKIAEFRRRTIGNTFREIIFGDRDVLEYWQKTPLLERDDCSFGNSSAAKLVGGIQASSANIQGRRDLQR